MGPGALETALALYQSPSLAAATRLRPVPEDVFEVIRIAAGEAEAIESAVERSDCPATVVGEAAQLYLKHVLFDPDADHYRVLGVAADADDARMREHRRWLLKWLHPDRADDWDAVYAARVQQAWQQLRDPVRRAEYDAALADRDAWACASTGTALRPVWTTRALAAGEGGEGAPARARAGTWAAAAGLPILAVALAWAIWPSSGPSSGPSAPTPRPALPQAHATPVHVLERVPFPDDAGHAAPVPRSTPAERPAEVAPPRVATAAPAIARDPAVPDVAASAPTPAAIRPAMARVDPPVQAVATAVATDTPEPVPQPPPTRTPERIDVDAVDQAMLAFRNAYERGDIDALMGVFTDDARNRRGGREAIRQDYVRLFRSSRQRRLQWHSLDWQPGPDHALGEGGFVASITPRRGTTNTVRGRVRVEVVQQGGQVRIRELWHEDQVP